LLGETAGAVSSKTRRAVPGRSMTGVPLTESQSLESLWPSASRPTLTDSNLMSVMMVSSMCERQLSSVTRSRYSRCVLSTNV
jgi:hypothetical protein